MHSFRLYLINAIHILTFPYRFVNIYFRFFSDFFQSCRFFIDKSFKAQKPPDAKRFAENRIAPPAPTTAARFRRTARTTMLSRRAARRADRQTRGKASRRSGKRRSKPSATDFCPARAVPSRSARRLTNRPYSQRTADSAWRVKPPTQKTKNRNNRTPITFDGKRKRPCLYSLRHILTKNAVINMADQQQKNTIVIPYRILYFLIGQDTEKTTEVPNHPQKVIASGNAAPVFAKPQPQQGGKRTDGASKPISPYLQKDVRTITIVCGDLSDGIETVRN